MKPFNLERWLSEHSIGTERNPAEIVFSHTHSETSILLPSTLQRNALAPFASEPLASFYRDYSGASIGNSQIVIGANVVGGVALSHGFRLPDLDQMAEQAYGLGVRPGEGERVFMVEAAWMFIYTMAEEGGRSLLRKYDRDFRSFRVIETLDEVFERWWTIVQSEPM